MALNTVLPLLGILLVIGLAYWLWVDQERKRLGIPSGQIVYQDTQTRADETLYSARLQLAGRPDNILQQDEYFIPVEVKTGRTPKAPYANQVMQVVAYCALVEEAFGVRPPHGILLFKQTQTNFLIEYTPEREYELIALLQDMGQKQNSMDVHRSHDNARKCATCGYKDRCDERL